MKDQEGNYMRCVCGKVCYTEREAGGLLNSLKARGSKDWVSTRRKTKVMKRKYHCNECGFWHLTHYSYYNEGKRR